MSQILSRESFDGWHQHIVKSPSHSLLSSRFAIKVRSVDFLPGQPRFVGNTLNLWRRTWISPAEGAFDTITEWLDGLLPDPAERGHLLDRLAFHAQHPEQKIRSATMLRGPQGSGKNTLITILEMIYGKTNVRIVGGEALTSNFNSELVEKQVLAIDEVKRSDGWDVANTLKPLLSEDRILSEGKREKRRSTKTPRLIFILSNDEAPLPIEEGDRRFFVPAYGASVPKPEFFATLYAALPHEVPAFFGALLARDTSAFSPDAPPLFTADKAHLQAAVRPPIERQLREWLADGVGPFTADIVIPRAIVGELRDAGYNASVNEATVIRALKALGGVSLGQLPLGSWGGRPRCWAVRNHDVWLNAGAAAWARHIVEQLTQLTAGAFTSRVRGVGVSR